VGPCASTGRASKDIKGLPPNRVAGLGLGRKFQTACSRASPSRNACGSQVRFATGHRSRVRGTATLLIEQNVAFALAIADRWAVLKRGAIDDQGTLTVDTASRIAQHFAI
jgi:hypothetical protein